MSRIIALYIKQNGYKAYKHDCLCEGNLPPKHVKVIKSKREGTNLKVSCWVSAPENLLFKS